MIRPPLSRTLRYRLVVLALGNAVLIGILASLLDEGASLARVFVGIGRHAGPVLIAAYGLSGVVFTGAIDLSMGSIIAVSGSVFGILVHEGTHPVVVLCATMTTAWALASLNGVAVVILRIPALIVTLAALAIHRGVALIVADLGLADFSGGIGVGVDYQWTGSATANVVLVGASLLALTFGALAKSPRLFLARGDSEDACRLQGVSPRSVILRAFFVHGFFLGLAALVTVSNLRTIEPARIAQGFELDVVGAVVLGGTSVFGGEGSYAGALLGGLFLHFLEQSLIYAGVSPYYRDVVSGLTILSVIGVDCWLHRRARRLEELR
jgi:ribose transport system permease protein